MSDTLTREDLHEAMRARRVADLRYKEMIALAKDDGWSNSEIARAVGLSEAAIRLYLKRAAAMPAISKLGTREMVS